MPSFKRTAGTLILKESMEQSGNSNTYPSLKGSDPAKATHNPQTKIIAMGKDFVWSKLI